MVQGTSSWAGKSLITTALCRHFSRRGLRVAPFKAQNMSNNARVVAGGEIGTAQYLQAIAARATPDVRMNPVLIKPEGDTRSQVVINGTPDPDVAAIPWRDRSPRLWPTMESSLRSLMREYDIVILEGAGSPAEINLSDCDMTNLRAAEAADAAVLMVTDINRGGAFAHLYGTWGLMTPEDRARISGFILNRFRGDPGLLSPAPERLTELTGVPFVGLVPWLRHELPDEDGVATPRPDPDSARPVVRVVHYPTASNLDELKPLERVADLRFIRDPADLADADLILLPGSKHVAEDLGWLRDAGFEDRLRRAAAAGTRILGICGGLQMLGERISDPAGVDGTAAGLGLLPVRTEFRSDKLTERAAVSFVAEMPGPWSALAGLEWTGYEIRHGRTASPDGSAAVLHDRRGWAAGSVLGITLHGIFEDPEIVRTMFAGETAFSLDRVIDDLTDRVMASLDIEAIDRIAGLTAAAAGVQTAADSG